MQMCFIAHGSIHFEDLFIKRFLQVEGVYQSLYSNIDQVRINLINRE